MGLELNRSLFSRLVQLYLLTLGLSIAVAVLEVLSPSWTAFHEAFDLLVEESFGTVPAQLETIVLVASSVLLVWHVAATAGLFWFKRWARSSFWMSSLVMWLLMFLPPRPLATAPWMDVLEFAAEALFGSILLLAYSREHGGTWFRTRLEQLSEIFTDG